MKKIALLTAFLMLAFSLTACGGQPVETQDATVTDFTTEATQKETNVESLAQEHDWVSERIEEPDCTQTGLLLYTCLNCDENYTEIIPACGHIGTGATCTEPSVCINCGLVIEEAWKHSGRGDICDGCGIPLNGSEEFSGETTERIESAEAS